MGQDGLGGDTLVLEKGVVVLGGRKAWPGHLGHEKSRARWTDPHSQTPGLSRS